VKTRPWSSPAATANAISVADPDAGASAILRVTITAANGLLTLSGTSGLSFTTGDGTADATVVFTGTAADINTALAAMTFAPYRELQLAPASVTITTNDQATPAPAARGRTATSSTSRSMASTMRPSTSCPSRRRWWKTAY
jgi:hypothetical protein